MGILIGGGILTAVGLDLLAGAGWKSSRQGLSGNVRRAKVVGKLEQESCVQHIFLFPRAPHRCGRLGRGLVPAVCGTQLSR